MWRRTTQGWPGLNRLINRVNNTNPLRPAISSPHNLCKHPAPIRCSTITTSTMLQVTRVVVEPPSCLHDKSVSLSVDGLAPGEEITLEASMTDTQGVLFMSHAHYRANSNGQVDVSTLESLGGSYKGVFPMGLLSSLSPALKKHKCTRFYKRDVENPNIQGCERETVTAGCRLEGDCGYPSKEVASDTISSDLCLPHTPITIDGAQPLQPIATSSTETVDVSPPA